MRWFLDRLPLGVIRKCQVNRAEYLTASKKELYLQYEYCKENKRKNQNH